jgi:hypothetical protein
MSATVISYLRRVCAILGADPAPATAAQLLGSTETDFGIGAQIVFRPSCDALRGGYVGRKYQSDTISHVFFEHSPDIALGDLVAEFGAWKEHANLSVSAPRQAIPGGPADLACDCNLIASIRAATKSRLCLQRSSRPALAG